MTQQKTHSRLAQYINAAISISPKLQSEITKEAGYTTSNNLTMIKQGKSRVALNRIAPLANALNLCPVKLMNIALEEYEPEVFEFIQKNNTTLSPNEQAIIALYRMHVGTKEPTLGESTTDRLTQLFLELAA
ncbi:hypothetical protein [Photobacterium nomapromontoriensis]|uniref:hypothetical protein n=1 Tax=Photobacterium nomapromontoriensis TaxID=2910237 RepID=UPI003D0AFD1C